MHKPSEDGVTHVNVYSKGKTWLGRMLTNFAHTPFVCADGRFESVEGYWYWLGTDDPRREQLRNVHGWEAKRLGRELRAADWQDSEEFKSRICAAIHAKLETHPRILAALRATALPLTHYYVFGSTVNEPQQGKWVLECFEGMRAA